VLIQESKVGTCDVQPGRRPTGPALRRYVEGYLQRAGLARGEREPIVTAPVPAPGDRREDEDR
jgi:formate dehydrogenase major subunit